MIEINGLDISGKDSFGRREDLSFIVRFQWKTSDHLREAIQLLFPHSLAGPGLSVEDVCQAVRANDRFTREYLFDHIKPELVAGRASRKQWVMEGLRTLMEACMTGNRTLFCDVWRFVRHAFVSTPDHYRTLEPRLDRALQLCTDGDLTPLMMVLVDDTLDVDSMPYEVHAMFLAARCGHLPAVKLWSSRGVRA